MSRPPVVAPTTPLLVDFYELTMAQSYLAEGVADERAVFQATSRSLPAGWGYLVAAGIAQLLDDLAAFSFDSAMLAYLEQTGIFSSRFLERLAGERFRGSVWALAEGTVFTARAPIVELHGSLFETQLVETLVLNRLNLASLVAAKASRCVEAAQGRSLVDFALRRTHGADAGFTVARSSYLAGFGSTSNVFAAAACGIPVSGTMAHSYVEAFADEEAAFDAFTRLYPTNTTLLIDTYDTLEGARRAARVAHRLSERGGRLAAVRIDSGDLVALSSGVRDLLDADGLGEVGIVVSGNLDEHAIAALLAAGAPIDGFGVGTRLGVSADAPSLDIAYKPVQIGSRPVMKLSPGKQTLPGSQQLWRRSEGGVFVGDLLASREEEPPPDALPLLEHVFERGERIASGDLASARVRAAEQRAALATPHRSLQAEPYPLAISDSLRARARAVAHELKTR